MNNTNRPLNRIFSAIIGLLLAAGGGGILLLAVVPELAKAARVSYKGTLGGATRFVQGAPLPGGSGSWWLIALTVALVILALLLLRFIFRQGHGHTGTLITTPEGAAGTVSVDSRVAERLLSDALDDHRALLASHVSTYNVRGTPVLKVAVQARRGVSPTDITTMITPLLSALNSVLGRDVAASIHIGAGIRTRTGAATRLE
ncbi:MAG: hypothetical protein H7248_08745 [Microbacteriaceae bacterium]|nr:hypothetical protein [Microbacteriaceae bacterium]